MDHATASRFPKPRIGFCMYGTSCVKDGCPYKHPFSLSREFHDVQCQRADILQSKAFFKNERDVRHRPTRSKLPELHHPRTGSGTPITRLPNPCARFRKPCKHGLFCSKFGCSSPHPSGRRQDCESGIMCTDESCPKLHPRSRNQLQANSKFEVGQQVEAQYDVGKKWKLAHVLRVQSCSLHLQFVGWSDSIDIPFARIRQQPCKRFQKPCNRFQKPCKHGLCCTAFGCCYAHPPERRQECESGIMCTDETCPKLYPRVRNQLESSSGAPKFEVGQQKSVVNKLKLRILPPLNSFGFRGDHIAEDVATP